MTPEEARKLLEAATPGPWVCVGEDDEYPRVARVGHLDITNDAENYNARLIAAAPELAELVAGLRYEYAVQNTETGAFLREEGDGVVVRTSDPLAADWDRNKQAVEAYAVWMTEAELTEYRVMARLAGDPEVTS